MCKDTLTANRELLDELTEASGLGGLEMLMLLSSHRLLYQQLSLDAALVPASASAAPSLSPWQRGSLP